MVGRAGQRFRKIRIVLMVIAVGIVALFGYPITKAVIKEANRSHQLHESLVEASGVIGSLRFELKEEWLDVPPLGIDLHIPRNTCSAVVGASMRSNKGIGIQLEMEGSNPVRGKSPLVWCNCESSVVRVKLLGDEQQRHALRWMSVPASKVGGIRVLASNPPKGVDVKRTASSDACANVVFSNWAQRLSGGNLKSWDKKKIPVGLDLRSDGFRILGVFDREQPYGVIPSGKGDCVLLLPDGFRGAGVTLMNGDGDQVVEDYEKAVGWCSYHTSVTYSVWRAKGEKRDWLVVAAQADMLGGMAGLREAAERYGNPRILGVLGEKDLTEDAVAALRGSGVGFGSIQPTDGRGLKPVAENLVVSFSLRREGSYLPEVAPSVPLGCEPEQERSEPLVNRVCVQARPQLWRADGVAENQGAAQGVVPFWVRLLAVSSEPGTKKWAARLLAFGRRMSLMGFRPTMTEGVREDWRGAKVSWRRGVKEVVVVGVRLTEPMLVPMFKDKPWKLGGKIPVTELSEGKTIYFRAPVPLGRDARKRRVIVWRR